MDQSAVSLGLLTFHRFSGRGVMEMTTHDFVTALHGMGFGALFILAFSGAIAELYRLSAPGLRPQ